MFQRSFRITIPAGFTEAPDERGTGDSANSTIPPRSSRSHVISWLQTIVDAMPGISRDYGPDSIGVAS